jgi:TonB family protein
MNPQLLAANIAAHWVQSGLLVGAALLAIRALKVGDPRVNLLTLQLVLAAVVMLPLVQSRQVLEPTIAVSATMTSGVVALDASPNVAGPDVARVDWARAALFVIAVGAAMRLLWLGIGVARLSRLRRRLREIPMPEAARDLEAMLAVSPRYAEHPDRRGPSTFGVFVPMVSLPHAFDALDPSVQRAVLCHELVHVRRRDAAVALGEELIFSMLWFHPLLWLGRAQIRAAREQVVDRQVVEILGDRAAYARNLVALSGHDLVPHLSAGMLNSRELRARIDAILQEARMSRTRFAAVALALITIVSGTGWFGAWAMPFRAIDADKRVLLSGDGETSRSFVVSGFAPSQGYSELRRSSPTFERAPADSQAGGQTTRPPESARRQTKMGFAEYPADALERGIRGTVIVAITVNAAGQVTTASIVSGPPELRASAFKAAMGLEFSPAPSTTAMTISVEYFLESNSWGVRVGEANTTSVARDAQLRTAAAVMREAAAWQNVYRIGGSIRPPRKIADVPPNYPEAAQEAKVQGVVIVEARIDESGAVTDTRLLRSVPLLDQAALDAVKQWKYEPTMLNGVPVPVVMTVTVNFTLRGPVTLARLNILIPSDIQVSAANTRLSVRPNDVGVIIAKDNMAFGFVPLFDERNPGSTARVAIYRMNPDTNAAVPQSLGAVDVAVGGGVVQSPTSPSFGIELLSIETR